MSKAKLKKYLQTLTQEQLLEVLMDMYDARKAAKEYLEFFLDPDAGNELEKVKKEVSRIYFTPQGRPRAKFTIKDSNDLVADFIRLNVDAEHVADLMIYHAEMFVSRLVMRRIVRETAWQQFLNLYTKARDYVESYDLLDRYGRRLEKMVDYVEAFAPTYLGVPEKMKQND